MWSQSNFCHTRSFDGETEGYSETTGFVVDAEKVTFSTFTVVQLEPMSIDISSQTDMLQDANHSGAGAYSRTMKRPISM